MAVLAFGVLGAAGFWLRGSALFHRVTGCGATTARIVCWSLPLAALAWVMTPLPLWWCAALAAALWAGSLLGWWGSIDLGRHEGEWRADFIAHTARGLLWAAPAGLVLIFAGGMGWPLWIAGLLCGAAYEVGWRAYPARATEIGEGLFGAMIGAALAFGLP